MASDKDYMAFLDKANNDSIQAQPKTSSSSRGQFKTVDAGTQVPAEIQSVCRDTFYVSDADEPFEGVSLRWKGDDGLPDEVEFAELIGHAKPDSADVTILDPLDWDSKGQYIKILEAVRQASQGNDVRVYRVAKDGSRVEYWLITREEGRIVGAKALSVES
ncbi:Conserved hypothetical, protein [Geosmithia morbida]|uniref:Conserved hypothetical, protein n=1 Tax=Geosmithia morbida TaxID=1094350 RepID=A0A9P4YXX8_9HYPO|nr:Conserved hypothetical, protein [Geosmithia morbida]KAF4123819.1 Conserved hypothetical, protein [Geosmithia morbida]